MDAPALHLDCRGHLHSLTGHRLSLHVLVLLCVSNYAVIFSMEILNLYWDFLPFRGGSNFLYGLTGNASHV